MPTSRSTNPPGRARANPDPGGWFELMPGYGVDVTSYGRWSRTMRCSAGVWGRPVYGWSRIRVPWLVWALFARYRPVRRIS